MVRFCGAVRGPLAVVVCGALAVLLILFADFLWGCARSLMMDARSHWLTEFEVWLYAVYALGFGLAALLVLALALSVFFLGALRMRTPTDYRGAMKEAAKFLYREAGCEEDANVAEGKVWAAGVLQRILASQSKKHDV